MQMIEQQTPEIIIDVMDVNLERKLHLKLHQLVQEQISLEKEKKDISATFGLNIKQCKNKIEVLTIAMEKKDPVHLGLAFSSEEIDELIK